MIRKIIYRLVFSTTIKIKNIELYEITYAISLFKYYVTYKRKSENMFVFTAQINNDQY